MLAGASGDSTAAARLARWGPLDAVVGAYALWVAVLAAGAGAPRWPLVVSVHGALLLGMWCLPARGASWERPRPEPRLRARLRGAGWFLRYTYPAALTIPFFEEVALTVNALAPAQPYWFEPWLYAANRELFGASPAVALPRGGALWLDEVMHAFYFAFYPMIVGGVVLAWRGSLGRGVAAGVRLDTVMTAMMLGFILAYVWYPFLPARGPWENPALMAGLRDVDGPVFTPLVEWLLARAAVSGGCFPSAHVAGAWALTLGLFAAGARRPAWVFAGLTAGLAVACVYTRYHHGVDVLAGLAVGTAGGVLGRVLTRPGRVTVEG